MRLSSIILILTLVGSAEVFAAPSAPTPKPGLPSGTRDDEGTVREPARPDVERTESVRLAPASGDAFVPSRPALRRTHVARPDWRWQLNAGALAGSFTEMNANESTAEFGVLGLWKYRPEAAWDFELALTTNDWVRFGFGHRHALDIGVPAAPYWRWSVSQTVENNKFFGGLTDLERVKGMISFGLADLFEQEEAWNLEAGAGWGMKGFAFEMRFGWNFDL